MTTSDKNVISDGARLDDLVWLCSFFAAVRRLCQPFHGATDPESDDGSNKEYRNSVAVCI